jgi:O-antigen ligase
VARNVALPPFSAGDRAFIVTTDGGTGTGRRSLRRRCDVHPSAMTTLAWVSARSLARRDLVVPRRELAAGALGALLPLSVGLTDGGYFGRVDTPLTVAFGAVVGLAAVTGAASRPSGTARVMFVLLGMLAAWTALSATWAVPGALVEHDARRALLYAVAFGAVVTVVDVRRRVALLRGLVGGAGVIAIVAIAIRAGSGAVADRFYGSLAAEPVGYPNALGALMAIGVVLATGLSLRAGSSRRALQGLTAVLVLVLGLTESRGAALALAVGLCALAWLGPSGARACDALRALLPVAVGALGWLAVASAGTTGSRVVVGAIATFAAAACVPVLDRLWPRHAIAVLACGALIVAAALVVAHPVSTTSSFRTTYWVAALDAAREHPALGTGSGSFHLTWLDHGPDGMFVRDAHSLYVEALSELGPVGLVLVVTLVALPVVTTVRRRGDPISAMAGAAFAVFAVHAGLDWDWEMPVVTLAALACAGVALAHRPSIDSEEGS